MGGGPLGVVVSFSVLGQNAGGLLPWYENLTMRSGTGVSTHSRPMCGFLAYGGGDGNCDCDSYCGSLNQD